MISTRGRYALRMMLDAAGGKYTQLSASMEEIRLNFIPEEER